MTAVPLTDPTDFGNRPGEGPLRRGGQSVGTLPQTGPNLPSTLSPCAQQQQAALSIVRDLIAGADKIRERATVYLPQAPGEKSENYRNRLMRSVFHNFFGRTVEGLTGLVFRKDPVLGEDVPPKIKEHWENLDLAGTHGDVFVRDLFEDALATGHDAILIEFPQTAGVQGHGEEKRDEVRPYWVMIRKDDILSWRTTVENGRLVLTQVVLKECHYVADGDYGEKEHTQYRVLRRLKPDIGDATVTWELLEITPQKTVVTMSHGTYSNQAEIPLVEIITNGKLGLFHSVPPLLDVAYLNVAHYQKWSDLATAEWMTCVPILFGAGVDDALDANGQPLPVGPNSACWTRDPNAKLAYVTHDGQALAGVRESLDRLESTMGTLGLAMLAPQKRATETAEAKRLDKATSDSALAVSARGLQDGVERALGFHARYLKLDDGGSIVINRDFEGLLMDAPVMQAYAQLYAAGFPIRAILEALQAGGRIPADADLDELEMDMMANAASKADAAQQDAGMEGQGGDMGATGTTKARAPRFPIGTRVRSLVNHGPGMKGMAGVVSIANAGAPPYYGVTFDGEAEVHKWLSEDEIEPEGQTATGNMKE
jgi:hypothetical protein